MILIKFLHLPSSIIRPLIIFVFAAILSACSNTDGDSTKASASRFELPAIKNPWNKTDPKYAQLADGALAGDIGNSLPDAAMKKALEAEYNALESRKSGESIAWQYSAQQKGMVTTFPPYQVGTSNCRRYIHTVSINGQSRQSSATACRDKSGKWTPLT